MYYKLKLYLSFLLFLLFLHFIKFINILSNWNRCSAEECLEKKGYARLETSKMQAHFQLNNPTLQKTLQKISILTKKNLNSAENTCSLAIAHTRRIANLLMVLTN